MSLVYITYHEECIYDVEKDEGVKHTRSKLHVSKFKKGLRDELQKPAVDTKDGAVLITNTNKHKHRTFGYAETPLRPPCDFLRKHQGIKWKRARDHVCPEKEKVPPVPRCERSTTGSEELKDFKGEIIDCKLKGPRKSRADFIALNIKRAKTAKPKKPVPKYVDTPYGDTHELLNTGLVPQYICSRNFGKVPCYLHENKKKLDKVRGSCHVVVKEHEDLCSRYIKEGIRQMTVEEREEIIKGLKTNLAETNRTYLGLSLVCDTIAKKNRKAKLERDLRQLEQDIFLMEKNKNIFISEF